MKTFQKKITQKATMLPRPVDQRDLKQWKRRKCLSLHFTNKSKIATYSLVLRHHPASVHHSWPNKIQLLIYLIISISIQSNSNLRSKRCHTKPEAFFHVEFTFFVIIGIFVTVILIAVWTPSIENIHQKAFKRINTK